MLSPAKRAYTWMPPPSASRFTGGSASPANTSSYGRTSPYRPTVWALFQTLCAPWEPAIGPNGDWAELFARDRQVFGADRSALLTSFYRRAPDLARTVHRDGTLLGYCFGRPGYLYRQLGPIVAEDVGVARDLVAGCLAGRPGEKFAVDVPLLAREWIGWLESSGFTLERPFLRMCRGQLLCPGLAALQFAIAGPEFG
jgi:hypothetical protein